MSEISQKNLSAVGEQLTESRDPDTEISELQLTWQLLRQNLSGIIGLVIVGVLLSLFLIGPIIAPYDPVAVDMFSMLLPPSNQHLMGTDILGRDVFSRVLHGARYSLGASLIIVSIAVFIGTLMGLYAGYKGGYIDEALMRITDVFMAFPSLVLAIAISVALGPSLVNAITAVIVARWPIYARLVRGQTLSIKEKMYVESARAVGEKDRSILFRYILPNTTSPILVQATLDIGIAILFISGLGFVGAGAQAPLPEWGAMIASGRQYLVTHYWISLFPGLAIMLSVFGFNLLGDALRDILDPRIRYR